MWTSRTGTAGVVVGMLLSSAVASGAELSIDELRYESLMNLAVGDGCTVTEFDLGEGRVTTLRLSRFEVLAPDAIVLDGDRALDVDVVLLRGTIVDDPKSQVFLGVSPHGTHGFIRGSHPALSLSTGPFSRDGVGDLKTTRVFDIAPSQLAPRADRFCLSDETFIVTPPNFEDLASPGPMPCRRVELAVDTDYEYTANRFGGDVEAAAAYAITLFAADSEIYHVQLNVRFVLSYLRLWSENIDPYAGGAIGDTLPAFRDHWNAAQSHVHRDLAHILSGGSGGGVAWLGVVCHPSHGYAASAVNGFFPMPVEDHHPDNWDLVVTCHEIGHNFGTPHTHDYEPQIDNCAGGECDSAAEGTLMSYCHLCPGGIANMGLEFHPTVRVTMLNYLTSTCDLTVSPTPVALDDAAQIILSGSVDVDVLLNDLAGSCDASGITIADYDTVSAEGGTVELIPGGALDRPMLRYTAPAEFTGLDLFSYQHDGGASATVTIDVVGLRAPDGPGATSGTAVEYYALDSGHGSLPDFDGLTPASSDIVDQINFASTGGNFATSGLSDNVGAVFDGFVAVPADGIYTLYTNSDDGSRLYVGDQLVVDNDGLHGMVEIGGQIPLAAGAHAVRVEFFEAGGGAGLIVSYAGPGLAKQVVPSGSWTHDNPCAADLDGDGTIGLPDLLELLANWGPCISCPADIDGDGDVDMIDLLGVLGSWGPC